MEAPAWVAIVVALIALIGVLVTGVITLRTNRQLRDDRRAELESTETRAAQDAADAERRDRRDRAVEIYQWAAELAVSGDPRQAQVGVNALTTLLEGHLLDPDTALLVEAALAGATSGPMRVIEQALGDGDDVRVVQVAVEAGPGAVVPLGSEDRPGSSGEET